MSEDVGISHITAAIVFIHSLFFHSLLELLNLRAVSDLQPFPGRHLSGQAGWKTEEPRLYNLYPVISFFTCFNLVFFFFFHNHLIDHAMESWEWEHMTCSPSPAFQQQF